jgi:DNA-binding FadR family transcriptional regulator
MTTFTPVIAPTRLYRTIATQIATRIQAGEFVPGERLPSERELAERLGVSRPSIREALIALEIEGMVDVRVGTGVFVLPNAVHVGIGPVAALAAQDIGPFDLLDARLIIEPECVALTAQRASSVQIAEIAAAHRAMAGIDARGEHDRAFHEAIGAACGNAALAATLSHLWRLTEASPLYSKLDGHLVTGQVWEDAFREHARIVLAIEARDPIRARHAMRMHLDGVLERLRVDFASEATTPV